MRIAQFTLLLTVMLMTADALAAQGEISVVPRNDLRFGELIRGVPTSIAPFRLLRSGLIEVRGSRNASIRIEYVLPPTMRSAAGDQIPLTFGADDGFAVPTGGSFTLRFNPQQPLVTSIGWLGRMFVFLGGTAEPSRTQRSGSYRAVITLTVYSIGT